MAALVPQRPGMAGAAPTYQALNAGGDTIVNDGTVRLHYKSAAGGSLTVKVDDPTSQLPNATAFDPDVTLTIPAGVERVFGPFPVNRFGTNLILTYPGGVTGLTCFIAGG